MTPLDEWDRTRFLMFCRDIQLLQMAPREPNIAKLDQLKEKFLSGGFDDDARSYRQVEQ